MPIDIKQIPILYTSNPINEAIANLLHDIHESSSFKLYCCNKKNWKLDDLGDLTIGDLIFGMCEFVADYVKHKIPEVDIVVAHGHCFVHYNGYYHDGVNIGGVPHVHRLVFYCEWQPNLKPEYIESTKEFK